MSRGARIAVAAFLLALIGATAMELVGRMKHLGSVLTVNDYGENVIRSETQARRTAAVEFGGLLLLELVALALVLRSRRPPGP